MGDTLEKLNVIIEGTVTPYKKALNEAKSATKEATESMEKDLKKFKNPLSGFGASGAMKKIQDMQASI